MKALVYCNDCNYDFNKKKMNEALHGDPTETALINMFFDDVKELVSQIKAIGINLNQLTRAVNSGEISDIRELKEMKSDLDYVWREVLQALKKVNG